MDNFLDTYHLPKLNKDEISNLNKPITSGELEAVIKSPSINVSPGQDGYSTEYYQTFKEGLMPILVKLFHNTKTETALPKSFYDATVNMLLKTNKDPIKKENYRPIYKHRCGDSQ